MHETGTPLQEAGIPLHESGTPSGQQWDAEEYAANGRFVADLASEVVALLDPRPGERILDVGCGDGVLTERLARSGAVLTGCDQDGSMLAAAEARGVHVVPADMTALPFQGEFDAVFSNAALHWTRNQKAVLRGVHRALVPGGRFVAEMGGLGNIAAIRVALQAVTQRHGVDAETEAASFYPSATQYRALLESNGFLVQSVVLVARPTHIASGMATWLRTFRKAVLARLSAEEQEHVVTETVSLLAPVLLDTDGTWWADYVRLRFHAERIG